MVAIRPKDLIQSSGVGTSDAIIVDNGVSVRQATPAQVVDAAAPVASQAEAEAGTENTKRMTALRVKQAIDQQSGAVKANAAALGVAASADNMGTFTGSTISDSSTAKEALQELETAVETKANATALGVAATAANMGTFTGSTIPDNQTAKQAVQALETALETVTAGTVTTNLTSGQLAQITTGNQNFTEDDAKVVISNSYSDANILPALYVSTLIEDDSGASAAAKVGGIYAYLEQTGTNTNQYPKAIAGTAVNAAAGNNDATGVVGYAYKLDVTDGIGDAAGAGGVAWQYSTKEGLVIGGEFACHQRVAGTSASASSGSGNNSINLHLTSNSDGARGWAAQAIDSQGLNSGKYGYWNAVVISRSCFGAGAEGMGQTGTVGFNFGNNTTTGPEKAFYLGNAEWHLWRSTTAATRMHGSTLDFERVSDGAPGMRLITPSGSFQGGYFGAYAGSTGPDGTTSVQARGAFSVDSSGYVTLISYNQSTGAVVANIGVSPNSNAFIPRGSSVGSITVGASAARIGQVFTTIAEDVSSDERLKTDIQSYPDALLDAWGDVEHVIYHLKADKKKQGKAARFRMGLIAQQVLAACAARGMTEKEVMAFGFISLNKWEAQPEVTSTERVLKKHAVHEQVLVRPEVREKIWKRPPSYERILVKPEVREKILIKPAVIENGKVVEPAVHEFGEVLVPAKYRRGKLIDPGEYEEGEVIKPAIYADGEVLEPEEYEEIPVTIPGTEAGEMYSLNYTECLCIEAAYHRRRADRSEARIAAIEEKLGL